MIKDETRRKVNQAILNFARKRLSKVEFTVEELKRAFPFHAIFFPDEALLSFKLQRSIVTSMGMTLYPRLAIIIAKDKYQDVHRNYQITGRVAADRVSMIDRIIDDLRTGKRTPDHDSEMKEILSISGGELIDISVIADLFVGDFQPGPLFLEIKSPRPNLDVCAESKKKMLYFKALFEGRRPDAYLAFPYNPFVYREKYEHTFTMQIMDLDKEVLMGEEMWDKLGGKGTYEELLEIIEGVKQKLTRQQQAQQKLDF